MRGRWVLRLLLLLDGWPSVVRRFRVLEGEKKEIFGRELTAGDGDRYGGCLGHCAFGIGYAPRRSSDVWRSTFDPEFWHRSDPARPGPVVRSAVTDMNVMGLSVLTVDQESTCRPRGFHRTLGAPVTPVSSTWSSQGRYLCPCHEAWVAWYPFICWESAHQFLTFSWYNQSVCLIFGFK